MTAAIEQCIQIHKTQPKGHILLFLTGQDEIESAVERLHQAAEEIDKDTVHQMALPDLMVLPCYGALPHDQQVHDLEFSYNIHVIRKLSTVGLYI